ncbi:hypothetical protein MYX76_13095 [Desulfobacterota bacterium AH_259_B03_O07]|nr:hypothetical protein [Desulfobacterota bacterium AH_259_B03_O07]
MAESGVGKPRLSLALTKDRRDIPVPFYRVWICMAVFKTLRGMGRTVSGYKKWDTQRGITLSAPWSFLSSRSGQRNGKAGCEVYQVYGRHTDTGKDKVEA